MEFCFQIEVLTIFELAWPLPIFILDFNSTCQDLLLKPCQNTFELVDTVQKKPEFLGLSRDAQNVCAVAKGGTILSYFRVELLYLELLRSTKEERIPNNGLESRLYGATLIAMDGWIWHPPPQMFCRGRWHHKGERAWDRDHQTHSLIFDYY